MNKNPDFTDEEVLFGCGMFNLLAHNLELLGPAFTLVYQECDRAAGIFCSYKQLRGI